MKIAVIGGGISGLVAAYQLSDIAEVSLLEADERIGGHTHTVDVSRSDGDFAVDTGFIVFNDWTYPNFCKLLDRLGVESQPSDMSFGFMNQSQDVEFALPSMNAFFAQRARLLSPQSYRMLLDIIRFNRHGKYLAGGIGDRQSFDGFFAEHGYSDSFLQWYLIPMIAAIWSADPKTIQDLPAQTFMKFFSNHGLLNLVDRPQWRVIKGGSRSYIKPLCQSFNKGIATNCPVIGITRHDDHVLVETSYGTKAYDHVVIATHSDQALRMLKDPSDNERAILGAIGYTPNDVVLHTDQTILPKRRRAWASWNYRVHGDDPSAAQLTYHMNRLQSLSSQSEFCVSMNQTTHLDPGQVIGRYEYSHPAYSQAAVDAQCKHLQISGVNRTHYCGAYWGYGFHEDGVNSALAATDYFGKGTL